MSDAYLLSTAEALSTLTHAMAEAKAVLPEDVILHHWMAAKHSPAAWIAVESWYVGRMDADALVSAILTDMRLLSEAVACLTTITKGRERAEVKPDLKLAKVRRTG